MIIKLISAEAEAVALLGLAELGKIEPYITLCALLNIFLSGFLDPYKHRSR